MTPRLLRSSFISLQGSRPVAEPVSARRLRVLRGSAADPLNLLQVMLAKGTPLVFPPASLSRSARNYMLLRKASSDQSDASGSVYQLSTLPTINSSYDRYQRFHRTAERGAPPQLHPGLRPRASCTRMSACRSAKSSSARPNPSTARSRPMTPCASMTAPARGAIPISRATSSTGCRPCARSGFWPAATSSRSASSYKPIPGTATPSIPPALQRQPLRAKPGKAVTQLHYARQGIITPGDGIHRHPREPGPRAKSRITQHATRSTRPAAANPSAPPSPPTSPPSSSAPKSPAAAPSSRPTSITPRASR